MTEPGGVEPPGTEAVDAAWDALIHDHAFDEDDYAWQEAVARHRPRIEAALSPGPAATPEREGLRTAAHKLPYRDIKGRRYIELAALDGILNALSPGPEPVERERHDCTEACLHTCTRCEHEVDHRPTFHAPGCRGWEWYGDLASPGPEPVAGLDAPLLRQAFTDVSAGYMLAPDYFTDTYWRKVVKRYRYLAALGKKP